MIMIDVVEKDVTPSVELVSRDPAHHTAALEFCSKTGFLVSKLRKTARKTAFDIQTGGK